MASLSRDEMVDVIRGGGSVIHEGKLYVREEHLPDEAELSGGDTARVQSALDGIAAQRAQLDEQERKLLAAQGQQANKRASKKADQASADAGGADKS